MNWFRKKTVAQQMQDQVDSLVSLCNKSFGIEASNKILQHNVNELMSSQIDEIDVLIEQLQSQKQTLIANMARLTVNEVHECICECDCEESKEI